MTTAEIINTMIPPLKKTDDVKKALVWMDEFRCSRLPVVENGKVEGFISQDVLLEANDLDKKIDELLLVDREHVVSYDAHFYKILKIAGEHDIDMVAVVDEKEVYQGVITIQDIVTSFARTVSIQMQGSILILSLNLVDYSLSEISRLIEENDSKILSSIMIEDQLDSNKIKLNLKINTLDLTRVVATLERFGYKIIGKYQEGNNAFEENERLEMLMRYIGT